MRLEISTRDRDRILADAAASPHEICGLLLGVEGRVARVVPCANVHAEPARFFEIDPAALLRAHRAARAGEPAVIGHYHSHPSGRAEPSPRDAASALPDGAFWLIAAAGRLGAWCARSDGALHGRFDPVNLVACALAGEPPEEPIVARIPRL